MLFLKELKLLLSLLVLRCNGCFSVIGNLENVKVVAFCCT